MLSGQVAAITGGTRGIGRGIALRFLEAGASVVVNGRNPEKGAEFLAEAEAGDRAAFYPGSVTDKAVVEGLVDATVDRYGRIDILVLNAGGNEDPRPIAEMTDTEWDLDLAWNLSHTFWGIRRALKYMVPAEYGRIIAISSKQGKVGRAGLAGYVAAKHGVHGLVKTAALETGEAGITVNAVCPGSVMTDIVLERGPKAALQMGLDSFEDLLKMHAAESAIKRQVTVDEVATFCAYLASKSASGITGQALSVDGGVSPY